MVRRGDTGLFLNILDFCITERTLMEISTQFKTRPQAVWNALSSLQGRQVKGFIEKGFIEKTERGSYKTTEKGRKYLIANAKTTTPIKHMALGFVHTKFRAKDKPRSIVDILEEFYITNALFLKDLLSPSANIKQLEKIIEPAYHCVKVNDPRALEYAARTYWLERWDEPLVNFDEDIQNKITEVSRKVSKIIGVDITPRGMLKNFKFFSLSFKDRVLLRLQKNGLPTG